MQLYRFNDLAAIGAEAVSQKIPYLRAKFRPTVIVSLLSSDIKAAYDVWFQPERRKTNEDNRIFAGLWPLRLERGSGIHEHVEGQNYRRMKTPLGLFQSDLSFGLYFSTKRMF